MPSPNSQTALCRQLIHAARCGNGEEITRLCGLVKPSADNKAALLHALGRRDEGNAFRLLAVCTHTLNDPTVVKKACGAGVLSVLQDRRVTDLTHMPTAQRILEQAAEEGHSPIVKWVLPFADPLHNQSVALRLAAEAGQTACVEILMDISDINALEGAALRGAAANGQRSCAALLVNKTLQGHRDEALCDALEKGHTDLIDVFYPWCDAQWVVDELQKKAWRNDEDPCDGCYVLQERMKSEQQRKVLGKAVNNTPALSTPTKRKL